MIIIVLLAVIGVVAITIVIIKQETPEQKQHDEKYKLKSHKMKDTYNEFKQAISTGKKGKETLKNADKSRKDK